MVKGYRLRSIALGVIAAVIVVVAVPAGSAYALNVWGIYKEAQQLDAKGKYGEAIAKYQIAAAEFVKQGEYGNATNMYRNIGADYSYLGKYDEAVANWDKEALYADKAGQTQVSIAAKRKADALRSRAQLFVETNAGAFGNANTHGEIFEPKNGALLGAYAELDPAVHNAATGRPFYTEGFEQLTGKKHAAYLLYFNYGKPLSVLKSHIEHAKAAGTAIQIGLQPMKGLDEVQDDEYLRQFAQDLADAGIPVFLRFANEMNGDWVPWHDEPKKYKEKFRLVANVIHKIAPDNVAMVWAPDRVPEYTINDYYPGDAYVDWVGVSLYTIFTPTLDPLKKGEDRASHIEKFDYIYKQYAQRKPVFISEGGVSYMYPEKLQDKTLWANYQMKQFYASLPLLYPKVKGVFWFDSNHDSSNRVKYYMLSANDKLLSAYKKSIASPFYLSNVGEESPIAYRSINGSTLNAAPQKVSAYVKAWTPMLSKVTYEIGGKVVATANDVPWAASIDFKPYKGKKIEIVVKAYDTKGKLATTQKTNVTVK
ncbi:copper amine oxidase-like protein [Paenibacillus sp. CCS19]|uniref:glycoside hydrolase family 26 protein n=1 Tax=Paenibacillus sp. CCS19 TaxID=3158387 RepID=UPI00256D2C95|nr:glycosyl hydrolase [Paenibacillus cellulosilyticus]GMK42549.1 copper amine oxidase-like protein [Paenibacillus cellulosilyticus]